MRSDQLSSALAAIDTAIDELQHDSGLPPETKQALAVTAEQIEICKPVSSRLL